MIPNQNALLIQLKGSVHTYYVTKQCSKHEKIWRQNVPLKQKVMFISQTSLQTSKTCACVTGCTEKILPFTRVGPYCWHLKTFLVHIQIGYIHCIYFTYTHVRYMNARLRLLHFVQQRWRARYNVQPRLSPTNCEGVGQTPLSV